MDNLMPILRWAIWYGDGTVFRSEDGAWSSAPTENVQLVWLYHEPPYRTLITGLDEYRLPGETDVKYGAWMDFDAYQSLVEWSMREG